LQPHFHHSTALHAKCGLTTIRFIFKHMHISRRQLPLVASLPSQHCTARLVCLSTICFISKRTHNSRRQLPLAASLPSQHCTARLVCLSTICFISKRTHASRRQLPLVASLPSQHCTARQVCPDNNSLHFQAHAQFTQAAAPCSLTPITALHCTPSVA